MCQTTFHVLALLEHKNIQNIVSIRILDVLNDVTFTYLTYLF